MASVGEGCVVGVVGADEIVVVCFDSFKGLDGQVDPCVLSGYHVGGPFQDLALLGGGGDGYVVGGGHTNI